jgi:hypothetical protein
MHAAPEFHRIYGRFIARREDAPMARREETP